MAPRSLRGGWWRIWGEGSARASPPPQEREQAEQGAATASRVARRAAAGAAGLGPVRWAGAVVVARGGRVTSGVSARVIGGVPARVTVRVRTQTLSGENAWVEFATISFPDGTVTPG